MAHSLDDGPRCITCGDALHPERAEKYSYCLKPACQEKNAKGLTIVSVGVNKSSDQYQLLDDQFREAAANGAHHDQRRGTYGVLPSSPPAAARKPAATSTRSPRPAEPTAKRKVASRPARTWSRSKENLAVLYNEQGVRPDEIARRLGVSRYTVTQMILAGRRARGRY